MKKIVTEILIALIIMLGISMYQNRDQLSATTRAPLLRGNSQDGSSVVQNYNQPTLIYFFAPWCGVCKLSMGNLLWLSKMSGIEIIIVGLDYETPEQVFNLITEKGLTEFKTIVSDEKTSEQFKIQVYPTYYTIKNNGDVQSSSVGYSTLAGLLLRSWLATI